MVSMINVLKNMETSMSGNYSQNYFSAYPYQHPSKIRSFAFTEDFLLRSAVSTRLDRLIAYKISLTKELYVTFCGRILLTTVKVVLKNRPEELASTGEKTKVINLLSKIILKRFAELTS